MQLVWSLLAPVVFVCGNCPDRAFECSACGHCLLLFFFVLYFLCLFQLSGQGVLMKLVWSLIGSVVLVCCNSPDRAFECSFGRCFPLVLRGVLVSPFPLEQSGPEPALTDVLRWLFPMRRRSFSLGQSGPKPALTDVLLWLLPMGRRSFSLGQSGPTPALTDVLLWLLPMRRRPFSLWHSGPKPALTDVPLWLLPMRRRPFS